MTDIYSLLNINQEVVRDFPLLATRVADHQTEKVVGKNIAMLKQIEDRMFVDKAIEVSQQSIDSIIRKVKRFSSQNDTSLDNWSIRELRIVSYYLMKLRSNSESYHFALSLLDRGWRNMFFNGLVFYILNSWNYIEEEYREATCSLITKKLKKYSENNKRYLLYKNHLNLFESGGPIRMAALVASKTINLNEAPTIIGFKKTAFKQSYYSDVIIKYVTKHSITDLSTIKEILDNHDLDRTKKLIFAYLVEEANKKGDGIHRSLLCRFINHNLGDVTLASTWAPFPGATYEEAQRLKNAMKLVYMWFAQQVIEVFFEVCVQDKDRKSFWLKYVNHLSGFKIVGSMTTRRLLQNDNRIKGMFSSHFIETNSYASQTSALILFIKNKVIVEFSDTGALYVYNQEHSQAKLIERSRSLNHTNDLKVPSINMLIDKDYWGDYNKYNEEGRMTHQGHWQSRLASWMNEIVLSSRNKATSFFGAKDDKLFKATALSKDDSIIYEVSEEKPVQEEVKVLEKKEEKVLPSKEEIIYKKTVMARITSKWINQIRVVADNEGYYMHSLEYGQYVRFRKLGIGDKPIGNLWIKQSIVPNWWEIIHFYNGSETIIGYFKKHESGILYKITLSAEDSINLSFK